MKDGQVHNSHVIMCIPIDFNEQEVREENAFYMAVKEGAWICKRCGDHDHQLSAICERSKQRGDLTIKEWRYEQSLRDIGTAINNQKSRNHEHQTI